LVVIIWRVRVISAVLELHGPSRLASFPIEPIEIRISGMLKKRIFRIKPCLKLEFLIIGG
jgi:hypothetical protein